MIDPFSRTRLSVVLLLLLLATASAWAQQPGRPPMGAPAGTGDKVELIHADSLNVLNQPGAVIYRVINNVKLQQKGLVLYCDIAIQNKTTNVIEAYGNVRMVQGDTITVRGDTLYYYGNTRQANVLGNVVLKDRKMTLSTERLDYDMLSGVAHYPVKGRIVDRENVLTSDEGYYDTRTKQFTFQRNVRLLNQPPGKEKTTILADSLLYNSLTKIADFQGPTRIISKDGVLVARNGQYNTVTRISNFRKRATAETDKYILTGDTLNFDNVNEVGVAFGNVVIVNKADKTTLTGDQGRYNGKAGVSRMVGHALVRSPINRGGDLDTLFMRADTLFSFDNKVTKKKRLVGQKNVVVYKSDLQSRCDSLVYDVNDSLLYFYKKPIVWSQNYQMEADSMTAKLKNNRISTMFLKTRAFVISQDTLLNFNQVKGRQITAYFRTIVAPVKKANRPSGAVTASTRNQPLLTPVEKTTTAAEKTTLDRVLVEGNGQTIYFAVDDKNRMIGMNRTECSKMNIEFTNSRVTRIRNYGRPDMYLTPPKELTDEKKQLDGFRWREKEKPTKAQMLGLPPTADPKAVPVVSRPVVASAAEKVRTTTGSGIRSAAGLLDNQSLPKQPTGTAINPPTVPKAVSPVVSKPAATPTAPTVATTQPATRKPLAESPKPVVNQSTVAGADKPIASPVLAKTTAPAAAKPVSATGTTEPGKGNELAMNAPLPDPLTRKPLLDSALTLNRPKTAAPADQPVREPMLTGPVALLTSRTFTLLTVQKPGPVVEPVMATLAVTPQVADEATAPTGSAPIVTETTAPEKSAEPVGVMPVSKPVTDRPAEAAAAEPAKKALPETPVESAKPVAASSSKSTLPTRRAEKQQKAASQPISKTKPKATPARDESDLEQELNRKPKN